LLIVRRFISDLFLIYFGSIHFYTLRMNPFHRTTSNFEGTSRAGFSCSTERRQRQTPASNTKLPQQHVARVSDFFAWH